jgi:hypothetical protein
LEHPNFFLPNDQTVGSTAADVKKRATELFGEYVDVCKKMPPIRPMHRRFRFASLPPEPVNS